MEMEGIIGNRMVVTVEMSWINRGPAVRFAVKCTSRATVGCVGWSF